MYMVETELDDEYSTTPEHDSRQSDSDQNYEETDEVEDNSNNEGVFDTLKTHLQLIKKEIPQEQLKAQRQNPIIRSRYNAHYFAKVNYLDSKNFGLAKIPKYYLQMETHNFKGYLQTISNNPKDKMSTTKVIHKHTYYFLQHIIPHSQLLNCPFSVPTTPS
ncbi:hypothetical protein E2562_011252 [Oryza meyeriana var. granulata]|uniref:Uncharacterized protein n=1 Tax=Oryza meyeriana var. granulata TaxID=110450 RepID=A0A6G1BVQ1_9ORYZ|nr:hypothetical protein E2562_011252 [Oryza meyeriana var. granulata]